MRKLTTTLLPLLLVFSPVIYGQGSAFSGVSTKGNLSVWRIDHSNGAVSLCSFEGHINKPVCYPWSEGGKQGDFSLIAGDDVLSTWRIDAVTGAVSLCEYNEITKPPICTPWSE